MSKQNLEKALRAELETVNDTIDHKIIKGLSYGAEARRHKFIVRSLAQIKSTKSRESWFGAFGKSLSFASSFLF